MNVYVASSFLNKTAAREAMDKVEAAGHRITYDWTVHEGSTDPEVLMREAVLDLFGVHQTDVLILLYPFRHSSAGEATAALALRKPVIIVGITRNELASMFLFAFHPLVVVVPTIEDAIRELHA